jgi:purine-binding chemotaxis protein CheW
MNGNAQYCTFFLDGLFLGIEVSAVQEVLRDQEVTKVHLAPPVVEGLMNLRGQIVTVLDLRKRLERRARNESDIPINVVVRTGDSTTTSLLVDEIGDVLQIDDAMLEPAPPTLTGILRELVRGVYKLDEILLLILDHEQAVNLDAHEMRQKNKQLSA